MRKHYFRSQLLALVIAGGAVVPAFAADDPERGAKLAAARCAPCHGADGRGISPEYPSLAGQHPEYIVKQIFHFKTGQRVSSLMLPVVNELMSVEIRALAAHFSRLPPGKEGPADANQFAEGRDLFFYGNPASRVGPCVTCHGESAAGGAQMPRLAGQNRLYLERQLQNFKQKSRVNDRMMHIGLAAISEREMRAVAAYLSGAE